MEAARAFIGWMVQAIWLGHGVTATGAVCPGFYFSITDEVIRCFGKLVTVDILSVQPQCKICKGVTVWTVLSDRDIKRLRTGGIVSGVAQLGYSNGCGTGTLRVELGTASCYLYYRGIWAGVAQGKCSVCKGRRVSRFDGWDEFEVSVVLGNVWKGCCSAVGYNLLVCLGYGYSLGYWTCCLILSVTCLRGGYCGGARTDHL